MPIATPTPFSMTTDRFACAPAGRWHRGLAALALAAVAQIPLAAAAGVGVQPHGAGVAQAAACDDTAATRAALQGIAQELKPKGLAFEAVCSAARGAKAAGWVVQVRVVDGFKATKVVRGPLADGHEVDMGTPAGVALAGAQGGAQEFSPDVQHNRDWLRGLMARHQFDNLPDAWWHFAHRGDAAAPAARTQIAAR